MYCPPAFAETDPAVLHALIAAHPLGSWITRAADGDALDADHIPFLLDPGRGAHGTLLGHVARANPVWRTLAAQPAPPPSLVVFQGAQSYITPSWYASKREHGRVVPTWNYAVVHAHGVARAIDGDRAWLRALLERLTATHEGARAQPWRVADAPAAYLDTMLDAIVGIEIPIARLVGKWKVSQNQPAANRAGVVTGLIDERHDQASAMAALVRRSLERNA